MEITPTKASSILANLTKEDFKDAGTNPFLEAKPALEALFNNAAVERKALPAVKNLAENSDPRISILAGCILMQKWINELPDEVRDHPDFHSNALSDAFIKIKGGDNRSLSELQREYCEATLSEGEYLVRQTSRLPNNDLAYYCVSRREDGIVEHYVIKHNGKVWIFGGVEHKTFAEAVAVIGKGFKPSEKTEG